VAEGATRPRTGPKGLGMSGHPVTTSLPKRFPDFVDEIAAVRGRGQDASPEPKDGRAGRRRRLAGRVLARATMGQPRLPRPGRSQVSHPAALSSGRGTGEVGTGANIGGRGGGRSARRPRAGGASRPADRRSRLVPVVRDREPLPDTFNGLTDVEQAGDRARLPRHLLMNRGGPVPGLHILTRGGAALVLPLCR